jgi:hypothetical protein
MKIQDIKDIAKKKGVNAGKMNNRPYQGYSKSRRQQCLFCHLLGSDMRSDELPVALRMQVEILMR